MLEAAEYKDNLQNVLTEIKKHFDSAEIRGDDVASFVFAEKGNRAVEIYQSEASIVVEFWENEDQKSKIKANSYEKNIKLAIEWVKTNGK